MLASRIFCLCEPSNQFSSVLELQISCFTTVSSILRIREEVYVSVIGIKWICINDV